VTKISPTQLQQHNHHHHSCIISKLFFFFLMLLSILLEPIPIEVDELKANESTSKQTTNRHGTAFSTHLVVNLNMVELEYSMTRRKGRTIFLQ